MFFLNEKNITFDGVSWLMLLLVSSVANSTFSSNFQYKYQNMHVLYCRHVNLKKLALTFYKQHYK
jgi:hypothetical protein